MYIHGFVASLDLELEDSYMSVQIYVQKCCSFVVVLFVQLLDVVLGYSGISTLENPKI